jgi:hypothetical protein
MAEDQPCRRSHIDLMWKTMRCKWETCLLGPTIVYSIYYMEEGMAPSVDDVSVTSSDVIPLCHNTNRNMGLGLTQPQYKESSCERKARPACKADSLTAICEPIIQKMWEPRGLNPIGLQSCYRDCFNFL